MWVHVWIAQQTENSRKLKALLIHYAKADSKKEKVIEAICILHLELNEALFWRVGQLFSGVQVTNSVGVKCLNDSKTPLQSLFWQCNFKNCDDIGTIKQAAARPGENIDVCFPVIAMRLSVYWTLFWKGTAQGSNRAHGCFVCSLFFCQSSASHGTRLLSLLFTTDSSIKSCKQHCRKKITRSYKVLLGIIDGNLRAGQKAEHLHNSFQHLFSFRIQMKGNESKWIVQIHVNVSSSQTWSYESFKCKYFQLKIDLAATSCYLGKRWWQEAWFMITHKQIMESWIKELLLQSATLRTSYLDVKLCTVWLFQHLFFITASHYCQNPSPPLHAYIHHPARRPHAPQLISIAFWLIKDLRHMPPLKVFFNTT